MAPDDYTHRDDALLAIIQEFRVANGVLGVLELVTLHHAGGRDEPVIDFNAWDEVLPTSVSPTLLAKAASHDAALAPGPVGYMRLAMLLDLGFARRRGDAGSSERKYFLLSARRAEELVLPCLDLPSSVADCDQVLIARLGLLLIASLYPAVRGVISVDDELMGIANSWEH